MNSAHNLESNSNALRAGSKKLNSRIEKFYELSLDERLEHLRDDAILTEKNIQRLRSHTENQAADSMIENAIGTLEIPLGLGLNFRVNETDYVVPMATEEPSVIAACSHGAKTVLKSGGFESHMSGSEMIGQIQLIDISNFDKAKKAIERQREKLVDLANAAHPSMVKRGGGARDLEIRMIEKGPYQQMLIVHLLIDTCDAMGANTINEMAEAVAPKLESLTGSTAVLRILSNLSDRQLVETNCRIPFAELGWKRYDGSKIAEGIQLASQCAEMDPYRAATHNKGIMNGVDAVCLATGNDWRAMEAGAHGYCSLGDRYRPLSTWTIEDRALIGHIKLPVQIGTIGGTIRQRPTVRLAYDILEIEHSEELGHLLGAVGLAQNLSALRALATDGIQQGHMKMHARSVAAMAGAKEDERPEIVKKLLDTDRITVSRARALLDELRADSD